MSKIVESIWFDAYGMGLLWNLLLSDYLVYSYNCPDWWWRAWEIQCHCCCLFGSVELFKKNSKSVVFDTKNSLLLFPKSFLSKVMSWSCLLSLRMEVLLRFSFFIAQLKRKQYKYPYIKRKQHWKKTTLIGSISSFLALRTRVILSLIDISVFKN